jgi:crotonobetainyl-CoA:carnitine CoA-transferase CaiB-like acyl-CoA transferase
MQAQQVFAGIKVLTVAKVYAAPYAAYQFALNGADVIAIEEPGKGDSTRSGGSPASADLSREFMGAAFLAHGANKRSLTLNLREPAAQEVFKKLARDADIIIENLRTGDMERYGLGYDVIRAMNPRIIYASLTGYGQTGPKKRDAAIDTVVQAASGLMSLTGTLESGPVRAGATVIDYQAGLALTAALSMALYQRERIGEGQRVDVSMLETALSCLSAVVSEVVNGGFEPELIGNKAAAGTPLSDCMPCKEGHIMIAASGGARRRRLFEALGRVDIVDDPRNATNEQMRRNSPAIYAEIEPIFLQRTASEWEEILNKAGVPAMRVYSVKEAVEQPQVKARGLYHMFEDVPGIPGAGRKISVTSAPYKLSKSPAKLHSPPPQLGQHSSEILDGLGYSEADILALRDAGVI